MSDLLRRYEDMAKREGVADDAWGSLGQGLSSAVERMFGLEPTIGLEHALTRLPARFHDQARAAFGKGIGLCESPIERALFPWLLCQPYPSFNLHPLLLSPGDGEDTIPRYSVAVMPQMRVYNRRCDFALVARRAGLCRAVVVECDGREFHEDSAKDEARTVELLRHPRILAVTRLTGSAIFRNPREAAAKAARAHLDAWSVVNKSLAHKFSDAGVQALAMEAPL